MDKALWRKRPIVLLSRLPLTVKQQLSTMLRMAITPIGLKARGGREQEGGEGVRVFMTIKL